MNKENERKENAKISKPSHNTYVDLDFSKFSTYLIPFALLAGYISWYRNSNSNIIFRLVYVIIAYVLNVFYIAYAVYRWLFTKSIIT
jgi:hypothetical protein